MLCWFFGDSLPLEILLQALSPDLLPAYCPFHNYSLFSTAFYPETLERTAFSWTANEEEKH
jgi:hypothetical protein